MRNPFSSVRKLLGIRILMSGLPKYPSGRPVSFTDCSAPICRACFNPEEILVSLRELPSPRRFAISPSWEKDVDVINNRAIANSRLRFILNSPSREPPGTAHPPKSLLRLQENSWPGYPKPDSRTYAPDV